MFTTIILGGIALLVARVAATLRRRGATAQMDADATKPGSAPPDEQPTAAH
jgi:hypothetical protein